MKSYLKQITINLFESLRSSAQFKIALKTFDYFNDLPSNSKNA
jgi:hypothetical protein